MANKKIIKARDIVRDSLAGFTDADLMKKYQLSVRQLQEVREQLFEGGRIYVKAIAADIRARLTDFELMHKYSLSLEALEEVLQQLVDVGAIRPEELRERSALYDDPAQRVLTRRYPRIYVRARLPIYDATYLPREGVVRDLSNHGVRVASRRSDIGQVKTFLIRGGEFAGIDSFEFDVESRWLQAKGSPARYFLAGFQITATSDRGRMNFQKLLEALMFSEIASKT